MPLGSALTDPLISGIAKGSTAYKLVGSYVDTPLNWSDLVVHTPAERADEHNAFRAVITGKKSQFNSISDLQNTTLGISRYGSGSQTMAYVMALQQGWDTNEMRFQGMWRPFCAVQIKGSEKYFTVNNDIQGLIDSVNDGSSSAFMWEWFTTKPYADAGECRFVSLLTYYVALRFASTKHYNHRLAACQHHGHHG
jgi:hypothetical protein